jgi:hypothetical protein
MLNPVSKSTIIVGKKNDLPVTNLHDELVMMDFESGTYINLNKTGRIIWEFIEPPISVANLIDKLATKFKIEPEVCSEDTVQYIQKMMDAKIISVE